MANRQRLSYYTLCKTHGDIHPNSIILTSLISIRLKFHNIPHKSQKLCKRANECQWVNMQVCDEVALGMNIKETIPFI